MEDTIEFLQVELEKDFGYNDDLAIQALQQSILDLKLVSFVYLNCILYLSGILFI